MLSQSACVGLWCERVSQGSLGGYSIVPRLIGLPSTPVETTNDAGVAPPGEPCLAFCCTHTRADTTLGGVRALEDSLTVVVVLFGTMYTHSTQMFGESG